MKFFLYDENTRREYSFDVEDLEVGHWDIWSDRDGLNELLQEIDERFGGLLEDISSRTAIGFQSFYFRIREWPPIVRSFKRYFEQCGYMVS